MNKLFFCLCMTALLATSGYCANTTWLFDSDLEGWNTPSGTWNSAIVQSSTMGHDGSGALQLSDADVWYGCRNTVVIGTGDPSYTLQAWAYIAVMDATNTLGLWTWSLDRVYSAGTTVLFATDTLMTWQMKEQTGTAGTGLSGYIMLTGGTPATTTDPATVLFYLDDISYIDETDVRDWSLY